MQKQNVTSNLHVPSTKLPWLPTHSQVWLFYPKALITSFIPKFCSYFLTCPQTIRASFHPTCSQSEMGLCWSWPFSRTFCQGNFSLLWHPPGLVFFFFFFLSQTIISYLENIHTSQALLWCCVPYCLRRSCCPHCTNEVVSDTHCVNPGLMTYSCTLNHNLVFVSEA